MQLMGIEAIYRKQRTSLRQKGQATRTCFAMSPSNGQVWADDVTYLPIAKGFAYLVAILDLYSRKVLAFRVSNTLLPRTSALRPWKRLSV